MFFCIRVVVVGTLIADRSGSLPGVYLRFHSAACALKAVEVNEGSLFSFWAYEASHAWLEEEEWQTQEEYRRAKQACGEARRVLFVSDCASGEVSIRSKVEGAMTGSAHLGGIYV